MDKHPQRSDLVLTNYAITDMTYSLRASDNRDAASRIQFRLNPRIHIEDEPADIRHGTLFLYLEVVPVENAERYLEIRMTSETTFEYHGEIDEGSLIKLILVNGTAVVFPYMRQAVTAITAASNINPLMLPLLNIQKWAEQVHMEKKTETDQESLE